MDVNKRRAALLLISLWGTFVATRAVLHLAPDLDLNIGQHNIHHLFTGIILVVLCGILLSLYQGDGPVSDLSTLGFGGGLGLVMDEWVYLIATDGSNAAYLLPVSFWGAAIMISLTSIYVLLFWLLSRRWRGRANIRAE